MGFNMPAVDPSTFAAVFQFLVSLGIVLLGDLVLTAWARVAAAAGFWAVSPARMFAVVEDGRKVLPPPLAARIWAVARWACA